MVAVIIADIVGSKQIPDRPSAQRTLEAALAEVAEETPTAQRELLPTVGDELQGIYPDLSTAIATTLLVQLAVPVGIELRFGIGVGEIHDIPSVTGPLSEGEAWWAARAAIERVERLSRRAAPSARTWAAAPPDAPSEVVELVRVANAGLLTRDRAVAQLTPRARRLVHGRWQGRTQRELAAAEGISQSAVSQGLATADGGALLEGLRVLVPRR